MEIDENAVNDLLDTHTPHELAVEVIRLSNKLNAISKVVNEPPKKDPSTNVCRYIGRYDELK